MIIEKLVNLYLKFPRVGSGAFSLVFITFIFIITGFNGGFE